jgi:hypothetical protein
MELTKRRGKNKAVVSIKKIAKLGGVRWRQKYETATATETWICKASDGQLPEKPKVF